MQWAKFRTFSDRASADFVLGKLEQEGVPAGLDDGPIPGIQGFTVFVDKDLLHRAKWVTSDFGYSDSELQSLATRNDSTD